MSRGVNSGVFLFLEGLGNTEELAHLEGVLWVNRRWAA